jgi:DMSO/TMAO reductase YedYZ heme-binding membrane subunit
VPISASRFSRVWPFIALLAPLLLAYPLGRFASIAWWTYALTLTAVVLCAGTLSLFVFYADVRKRNPAKPRKKWLIEAGAWTIFMFVMLALSVVAISLWAPR